MVDGELRGGDSGLGEQPGRSGLVCGHGEGGAAADSGAVVPCCPRQVYGPGASATGTYTVTLVYCDGSSGTTGRQADISADGGRPQLVSFTPTGSFSTVGALTVRLPLNAGANTIELANPSAYAPDFNEIIVAAAPS